MSIYSVSRNVISSTEDAEVITFPERLDSSTAPQFEKIVTDSIASGSYEFVLDCHKIRFLTAAGLRMILASLRAVKAVEGQLMVRNLHGQARAMFEACGFDHFISVEDNPDAEPSSIAAA